MSLAEYTPEQIKEMSMLEVAFEVFQEKKQAITFNELLSEVVKVLGLSEDEVKKNVAQFYTDINIDGRFICIGEAGWGLRSWYPYEQIDEEVTTPIKPKKKKGKKAVDEDDDLDLIDFDEVDEDDLEYDDFDDEDEDDLDDDDTDDDDDFDDDDEDDDDDLLDDDDDLIDDEYEIDDDDEELDDDEDDELDDEEEDED